MKITIQNNNMSYPLNRHFLLSLLLMLSLTAVTFDSYAKAAITVTVSRTPVALDDSFHLIYEADSSVDDDPDFTPIYKHFDVLNSSQSTNMRSINGSWSMKKTWDLTIIAKDIGKFIVPPITFGNDISPAIQITVNNSSSPNSVSPQGQATVPAKIFLETEMDKTTGWVQAQFIYTVRLMRTVGIANASLSEPEASDADAIIEKISEDNYQKTRNGVTYEVFERRYAIFPQRSGNVSIKPLIFEGRVNTTQPRSIFDQFRMSGQLKRIRSKALAFTVRAAPKNINLQDWLPASHVQIQEQWSDDTNNIKTGEPVTRTILISAQGLTGAQLPELVFDDISNVKQYPDKAIIEDRKDANGITGLKQIKVALIPTMAGTYTLPEIKLQWWNTKTNKKETAIIPQKTLTAIGNASTASPAIPVQATPATEAIDQHLVTANEALSKQPATGINAYWQWLALFFASAWLITLAFLFKKSGSRKRQQETHTNNTPAAIKPAISALKKHAEKGDAENTRSSLIEWAKIAYADPSITNLTQISNYCSQQLGEEILRLNTSLYSPEKPSWQGENLIAAFDKEQQKNLAEKSDKASALKPLYS